MRRAMLLPFSAWASGTRALASQGTFPKSLASFGNSFSSSSSSKVAADQVHTRFFADYTIYKTSAAFSLKIISPTFSRYSDDPTKPGLSIERTGTMLLQFAKILPRQPGASAGGSPVFNSYNWESKITFAMSPVEVGILMAMEVGGPPQVFIHDPFKMQAKLEGQVLKKMTVSRSPDGSATFAVTMTTKSGQPANVFVAASVGELQVFKQLLTAAVPHLLGFDRCMANPPNIV